MLLKSHASIHLDVLVSTDSVFR